MTKKISKEVKAELTASETKAMLSALHKHETVIKNAFKKAESNAKEVAKAIYLINKDELFKAEGFKSIVKYCDEKFGIQKSAVWYNIKVYEAFADDNGNLLAQYADFSLNQLREMATLTTEQLEQVTIDTKVAEIKKIKGGSDVVATSEDVTEREAEKAETAIDINSMLKLELFAETKSATLTLNKDAFREMDYHAVGRIVSNIAFGGNRVSVVAESSVGFDFESEYLVTNIADFIN